MKLVIRLALDLHKSITEIMALPVSELNTWLAWYWLEHERLHPTPKDPNTITPEESRLAVKALLG
ncbi:MULTISPECIES: hypothetical protein [Aeromonas]|jgi:hypothetical protein|uniref:Uncharacterized protein n=1 Tax=Aeromonas caviae TaxID=648 RepID=A0ABU5W8T6_AERCA|nr:MULTISPECIES: hypothetical protein [Aeromonas]MBP6790764.1 hypothetical protein [Aeromonas sp.]HDT6076106.1 hypothetical protein [Aeromonas veronii bv. veronii]AUZ81331.1 hypothetical protein C2U37_18025 [Aeromonas sp. ASNIH1]MBP8222697.1 hypothetical protein [Aeromonas sp.]MBP9660579.1 hypothetical protein [Aeromonas sp.]